MSVLHVAPTISHAIRPPLDITTITTDSGAVLEVHGELDLLTAPQLGDAVDDVLDSRAVALIIDLSHTCFLSSVAMDLLVQTAQRCRPGDFAVVARGPATARPMHLVGLTEAVALYPTVEAALLALRTHPDGRTHLTVPVNAGAEK